jgi:acetoin utilization deacetylase AcuC-like enzyme
MGFCLFNNVAVAATMAREEYGIERTLIVDFDVHHGNGTQDIFYHDPSIFYFSIHQWPLFPGTGRVDEIGSGEGRGFTANVPIPARCGDDDYRRIFDAVLFPLARRFEPQLLLVSAGFDAYWADPLAEEWVTIDGFAKMVAALRDLSDDLCPGRLAMVLEGGYNPAGLGAAAVATLGELAGVPQVSEPYRLPDLSGGPEILSLIGSVKRAHGLE